MKRYLSGLSLLLLLSCNTAKRAYLHNEEQNWQQRQLPTDIALTHTLFMVGGVGEGKLPPDNPLLPILEKELTAAGKKSTIVFLGDNVPAFNRNSEKAMQRTTDMLSAELDILKNFKGKAHFLPGEKDWNNGRPDGREALLWQEEFIESQLKDDEAFLPGNACGKPEKVKISDDVRLLFADSQWWLENWDNVDNINQDCEVTDRFGFLLELRDDLKKYDKERVVLFLHHPLYSNGKHGGNFSWKHHLFPLTLWKKNAWLPLPGIGTLAVLARQTGASRQDAANPKYLRMRQEILKIAAEKPNNQSLIIAGAHDGSLQLFESANGHLQFLTCGSAGRADYARGGKNARFVQAKQGFSKLYFYENKEVWLEFLTLDKATGTAVVSFRKKLFGGVILPDEPAGKEPFKPLPDSITVAASNSYDAGFFKRLTFGDRYRTAWKTPVKVPIFNLNTEFKHFTPVEQGGGMSSKSLRLETKDGHEYVLRSVEKDVSGGLPKDLRETLVQDFIQDLKSGSHPYGAFVIPPLAEAAGVYHTNPRLFYLPRQERLGAYNDVFAEELYLFEERPDDDWSDLPSFGNSPEIISYLDVLEKIHKNPKHRIDEKMALKARLLDQFIHDYDRHDDQWRWASFPQGDSLTIYRPIPRDRDQAFFDLRGIVPFVISRKWLAIQQRGLNGKITDVPGEAYPGRVFDRTFLTGLDKEDWLATAQEMKANLTDSIIENAFKIWPSEIYQLNAPHIIETLKKRRDNIPFHAEKLYCFYARYVDVTGTEKPDIFEVERRAGGELAVSIFAKKKDGSQGGRYYHRIFRKEDTREVRLYGLGDDDLFRLSGKANKNILVRIIGGDGNDQVEDGSQTGSLFKKTAAYDTPNGMTLEGRVKDFRDNDLKINEYDRNEFQYNHYFPLVTFGRTVDDGLLFGGGVRLDYYRFRKRPYGIQHTVFARFSANTNALNLRYTGDYTRAFGKLDFNPDLRFDRPIVFNFFGLGNGTKDNAESSRFNWVRLEKMSISPLLKRSWYNGRNFTRFGPFFERVEVETSPGRITDSDILTPGQLTEKDFLGFTLQHTYLAVEGGAVPRNGLKLNLGATYYRNLGGHQGYARFEGSFATYVTVGSPVEFTFATRIGAAALTSDKFLFYHSNNLGGNNYLRGFRNNRFAGKSLFFHNTDLRIKLFYLRNHFMPFEFGIMGALDYGRVWHDGEDSELLHVGASPGFWITPYKLAAVSAFYTFTNGGDEDTYTVRVGFFF